MQRLGFTRSANRADHLLLTPDTFVRTPLPGMRTGPPSPVAPAAGAKFTQYTAELERGGELGPSQYQRFVYVLEGAITAGPRKLGPDSFAYVPAGEPFTFTARKKSRARRDRKALPAARWRRCAKSLLRRGAVDCIDPSGR